MLTNLTCPEILLDRISRLPLTNVISVLFLRNADHFYRPQAYNQRLFSYVSHGELHAECNEFGKPLRTERPRKDMIIDGAELRWV